MKVTKNSVKGNYFPPLLGNGSISLNLDYAGRQNLTHEYDWRRRVSPDVCVWWAGRRFRLDTDSCRDFALAYNLIPFGCITNRVFGEEGAEPNDWSQELDTDSFVMRSTAVYNFGSIETEAYVHTDYNLISIKKSFSADTKFDFVYKLERPSGKPIEHFTYKLKKTANGVSVRYTADGLEAYTGEILIFADKRVRVKVSGNVISLCGGFDAGESINYFILYNDSENYINENKTVMDRLLADAGGEFAAHTEKCKAFQSRSHITVSDNTVNRVCKTALYHLKTLSTEWSIPMGINDVSWQGCYFAFDEAFLVAGLLASNRFDEVQKILDYRYKGLKAATDKASNAKIRQANYDCLTKEDGNNADFHFGYWNDHVFQNACVAVNFFEYYRYTGDRDHLHGKGLPVIRHCAAYFLNNHVYRTERGAFVGAVTDLERLGPSVRRAYMTTCGIIKTLEICAEALDLFNEDELFAAECRTVASELRESLPSDGEMYLPYENCTDRSIGVFGGCFPFELYGLDERLQRNAMDTFVKEELAFGNMYAVGGGHINSWYAAWKGEAYAKLHSDEAYASLLQANASCGCFGEMFEINEPNVMMRPWFTTAAGSYIHAACDMLAQMQKDTLYILPAFPKSEKNVSFKLALRNNMTVSATIEDHKLVAFDLTRNSSAPPLKVVIPHHIDVSHISELSQTQKPCEYFYGK